MPAARSGNTCSIGSTPIFWRVSGTNRPNPSWCIEAELASVRGGQVSQEAPGRDRSFLL
jgi:hypothetical protein